MSTLNDLHGKVPPPPVHVVALGFNGPWEVMTMKVRLATCRDRNVADYIAALWNLMPYVEPEPEGPVKPPSDELGKITAQIVGKELIDRAIAARPGIDAALRKSMGAKSPRRKAGKSVQVMP